MFRPSVVLVALTVSGCTCSKPAPKPDFAAQLLAAFQEQEPTLRFEARPPEIVATSADGGFAFSLTATRFEDDFKRGETVAAIAKKELDLYAEKWTDGDRLVVGLRERLTLERLRVTLDQTVPFVPVGNRLAYVLFDDRPDFMALLKDDDLKRRDAGLDALWGPALKKLNALPDAHAEEVEPGLWGLDGDEYGSAFALASRQVHQLKLRGAPVVAVLDRESVLVVGSDDASALARLAELLNTKRQQLEGRDYFPTVLTPADGGWTDYAPAGSLFARLEVLAQLHDVGSLGDALREHADGGGPFIASLKANELKEQHRIVTTAVLTEGVDTVLPRADLVVLMRPPKTFLGFVRFDALLEVLGDDVERTDHWPQRVHPRHFPTAEQLVKLAPKEDPAPLLR